MSTSVRRTLNSRAAAALKPPRGRGLNKPAEITLHGIFTPAAPVACEENHWDADGGVLLDKHERLELFRRRLANAPGTEFVDYDAKRGMWKFRVKHFSRYGLDISDSDDDDDDSDDDGEEREGEEGREGGDVGMRDGVAGGAGGVGFGGFGGFGGGGGGGGTPKPAFAAPAANELFIQPSPGFNPQQQLDQQHHHQHQHYASTSVAFAPSAFTGRTGEKKRLPPPPATTGAAAAAAEARLTPFKRREPPMQTAYAVAASIVGASRRVDLPTRSRAAPELLTDAHSFFGASFRPSWGPGGRLIHAGRLSAAAVLKNGGGTGTYAGASERAAAEGSQHAPSTSVCIERFAPSAGGGDVACRRAALEVALAHTVVGGGGGWGEDEAAEGGDGQQQRGPSTPGRDVNEGGGATAGNNALSECGPLLRFRCTRLELPSLCLRHLAAVEKAVANGDAVAPPSELAAEVGAWDLLSVLYGDAEGGAPAGSAADRHRRRAGVSAWLRKQIARRQRGGNNNNNNGNINIIHGGGGDEHDDERDGENDDLGGGGGGAANVHATGGRVVRAVAAAVKARDPRLATLLAQSNAGGKAAALAAAQLGVWRGTPAVEKRLSSASKLTFGMLAGEISPPPAASRVSGWCQNFGLHLWYSHAPTATLARAVEGYLTSVEAGTAVFPSAPGSPAVDDLVSRLKDVSFNLLALASAGTVPADVDVAAVFHPLTYCETDLTNAALAWHLFVSLRAVGALPDSREMTRLADNIHVAFAQQLLAMGDGGGGLGGGGGGGRWGGGRGGVGCKGRMAAGSGGGNDNSMVEWAAYVAMHIEHGPTRRQVVSSTLHRRCADWCDDAGKIAFLRRRLGVPEAWLEEARRHWARYNWWDPETAF